MELVVAAQVGCVVEDCHVDAGVVHLGDQALGGHFKVVEHGRKVLLCVSLTLICPGQAVLVPAPGNLVERAGVWVGEDGVVGTGSVADSPDRLVVDRQFLLDGPHLLLEGRVSGGRVHWLEYVSVAVYKHVWPSLSGVSENCVVACLPRPLYLTGICSSDISNL